MLLLSMVLTPPEKSGIFL